MKKVVIIGAGASGLVAAIFARKQGKEVVLLEKNEMVGKKILATGNGRCNFWNEDQSLSHYRSSNFSEIADILTSENQDKILLFLKEIGIEPKIKNGYYYPFSNQAVSVQRALLLEAEKQGVKISNNTEVTEIEYKNNQFEIFTKKGNKMTSDEVILATGSKAAPKTGSDGLGYQICTNLKHTIVKPLPALVQLKANGVFLKQWEGIRVEGKVVLSENDKKQAEEWGELQLTNYGISGICIFNLSGRVARGLEENKKEILEINFLDGLKINSDRELLEWLNQRNQKMKNRSLSELLEGVLNYKLVNVLLNLAGIEKQEKWEEITNRKKEAITRNLIHFRLEIIGTNSFDKAQVCSGGVPLNEINPQTMESKKQKGLYLTGELLDVDGDCGGYNLEWAWITGMIAGSNRK